jgi:ribulose 1,5-bisphosphate carboxylase large subunit-like protein
VHGECASWSGLKLTDLALPESFVAGFSGPAVGLEGIREIVDAPDRPLLVTIMKPAIGLTPKESAAVFYQAAIGGLCVANKKQHEKVVSQPGATSATAFESTASCRAAYEETGHRTSTFVNITIVQIARSRIAHAAVEAGAIGAGVGRRLGDRRLGPSSVLAADPSGVPVMGHPRVRGGALYGSPGRDSALCLTGAPATSGPEPMVAHPSHLRHTAVHPR